MENGVVLVLVVEALIGSGVMWLAVQRSAGRRLDYEAFAREQGWTCAPFVNAAERSQGLCFTDPQDNWELQVGFAGGGPLNRMTRRHVAWMTPAGALARGEAVLGMPLPAQSVAMLAQGGPIGQAVLQAGLKATLHALGRSRLDLEIDATTAGHPGGLVMASPGADRAMDALRENRDLAQFRTDHDLKNVPIVTRSSDGLGLRRPGAVAQMSDLAALVDLGKSLRRDLQP